MKHLKNIYLFILLSSVPLFLKAQTFHGAKAKAGGQIDTNLREVNLGFNIKTTKANTTAAITSVSSANLASSATNPANALYGVATGLYVRQGNTVAWSNDPTINIRGMGSLNNNSPLILVDGFERGLNSLTLEEIESVSVIKDAAALALYGMRGANGVLAVTTKRGLEDKMGIQVNFQQGVNSPFRLPKLARANAYASALNEALVLDGLSPKYSEYDLNDFRTNSNPDLFADVDWVNEAIRDQGYTTQLNTSFKGGSDKMKYYSQISYVGDNGFIQPEDMNEDYNTQMKWNRLSARTNLDIQLTNSTNLWVNLLGQIAEHKRPAVNYPALFNTLYSVPSAAFPIKSNNIWGGNLINLNPIAEVVGRGYAAGNDRNLFADLRLTQSLSAWIDGLSAEVALAYDNRASYWDANSKTYTYQNLLVTRASDGTLGPITRTKYGQESALAFSHSLGVATMVTAFDAKLNYKADLAKDHQLNTAMVFHLDGYSENGRNNSYRRQNILANAEYVVKSKYMFNLAMSYAGSSVMTEGDKFRFFPAISAGWILSSEDFMSQISAVNYLKIRASWGKSGSDRFAYELDRQYFLQGASNYFFGANNASQTGHVEGVLPNNRLNAEMSYKSNIGIDARLFNALSVNAEVFYDKRNNILVPTSGLYSSVLGIGTPTFNDGEVKNYGVETSLEWSMKKGDWSYNLAGNFSFSRNEIVNMNEVYRPESYLSRTGNSVGQFFGLESIGFFRDNNDIASSALQSFSPVRPGDIKYRDQNQDGMIDEYDEVALGYSTLMPEIYYGFNIGFGYQNFGFRADFQGVANYSLLKNMNSMYWPLLNNTTVSDHYLENRWTPDKAEAKYPRLTTLDNKNNFRNNSVWLENGAFLKLRNIEFNYNLPKSFTQKIKLADAKVFLRGSNLFSVDHVGELDPEQMYATYPSFSSYYFGINLSF